MDKLNIMTIGNKKHNALWDAKVIKKCFEKLMQNNMNQNTTLSGNCTEKGQEN